MSLRRACIDESPSLPPPLLLLPSASTSSSSGAPPSSGCAPSASVSRFAARPSERALSSRSLTSFPAASAEAAEGRAGPFTCCFPAASRRASDVSRGSGLAVVRRDIAARVVVESSLRAEGSLGRLLLLLPLCPRRG